MLLTKLANQEIINFLRTVTIKNSYFADQLKKATIRPGYINSVPDERNPYYMHLAGQYVLEKPVSETVSDPSTGEAISRTYGNSFDIIKLDKTVNEDGIETVVEKRHAVTNDQVYLPGTFDEMMYVTSLDTQERIAFTVENLHGDAAHAASAVHKKTLEAYKVPGRYFDMLCEKYPKQVDLIKSIVYLVPPRELNSSEADENTARFERIIGAKHLELLAYDDTILEEREREDIVAAINAFLAYVAKRWDVKEYTFEENYALANWAMIWSLLPAVISAQRFSNIKSRNVHSTHIWNALTSTGLESLKGYLTPKQEFFLYKNIGYLRENRGQNSTLNILIDELLSEYGLHIESKSIVSDTTDILKVETADSDIATQCSRCARKEICFKNITSVKCEDFVGNKHLYKTDPVVLTETLSGSRKDRIISILCSKYGCTKEEATARYERAYVWRDQAIEMIRKELDRDQLVATNGIVESLADVIYRESEAGVEPEYNEDVVQEQTAELGHIRSSHTPTKLLEIAEDPTSAKHQGMFARFLTDTLVHLAPSKTGDKVESHVVESYSVSAGLESIKFTFNYGELIAAMYLGLIKETKCKLAVDTIEDGKIVRNFLPDDSSDPFNIKIPTQAVIQNAFRLARPVKQRELIDAYSNVDYSLRMIGNYRVTSDKDPIKSKDYYVKLTDGTYDLVETVDKFDKNEVYYEYDKLPELVTNNNKVDFELVKIRNEIYAVIKRGLTAKDVDWVRNDSVIEILGKFYYANGVYSYYENNDEIGVIPENIRWFSDHLLIRNFSTNGEMAAKFVEPKQGDLAYVHEDECLYIYDGEWRKTVDSDGYNIALGTTIRNKGTSLVRSERILEPGENGSLVDSEEASAYELNDPAEEYKFYYNPDKSSAYIEYPIDRYVNTDWIIDNYVDIMRAITSREQLSSYIEKMFTMYERMEEVASSSGSTLTVMALDAVIESIMVKKGVRKFKLVSIGDKEDLTYAEWFKLDTEAGINFSKIIQSTDRDDLWNEFNYKAYHASIEGCNLSYAKEAANNTKYRKLKELIRSLSSYLVTFIDGSVTSATDCEIPHITQDSKSSDSSSSSFVYLDAVGENRGGSVIGDFNGDVYIVTQDLVADGVTAYYSQEWDADNDCPVFSGAVYTKGYNLTDGAYYIKLNLKELLSSVGNDSKITEDTSIRVIKDQNGWYYKRGSVKPVDITVDTFFGDPNATGERKLELSSDAVALLGPEFSLTVPTKTVTINKVVYEDGFFSIKNSTIIKYLNAMLSNKTSTSISECDVGSLVLHTGPGKRK